jgi:inward rectifier potassium channel
MTTEREAPTTSPHPTIVRRAGERSLIIKRATREPFSDTYHKMLALPLWGILVLMAAVFVAANLIFTGLYMWVGGVGELAHGDFWNTFFFSVETFGTIGYGHFYPDGFGANMVMTIETFVGLVYVAVATGLVFARVSRPTARVTFSKVAVIHDFDGVPTLMFRAANRRANQIFEAEVMVSLAHDTQTLEGHRIRRFEELRVVRSRTPLFALTWTVMHRIDESSPLHHATGESLAAAQAELVVVMSGVDDRYAQRVHARYAYAAEDIRWGARFHDILSFGPNGRRVVDYRRFHDVVAV